MLVKVKLALQGACGSCPSSTTTMKMGIERVLNENFLNMGGVSDLKVNWTTPGVLLLASCFIRQPRKCTGICRGEPCRVVRMDSQAIICFMF